MCGGFTCSKNALIALNVLYIVSNNIFLFKKIIAYKSFLFSDCGVYFDWGSSVWRGSIHSDESTHRRWYFSLWNYFNINISTGAAGCCETSSSNAVFRILFT